MKTFEERFTAWSDGQLAGEALTAFEQELASRPEARAEKIAVQQLGNLLRQNAPDVELHNADFFNHQLLERIRASEAVPNVAPARSFWSLPRLAWAGVSALLLAGLCYQSLIPPQGNRSGPPPEYYAEVLDVRAADPAIYATALASRNDMAVVWLDGLDYLPETYALK